MRWARQVAPYTANTPEDWRKLADAKVDAIITDDPVALLCMAARARIPRCIPKLQDCGLTTSPSRRRG